MTIFKKMGVDEKVIFLHIPKTGGNSITKAFEESGWFQNCIDFGVQHSSLEYIHTVLLKKDLSKVKRVFTVIRNPISRLVSEIRGGGGHYNTVRTNSNFDITKAVDIALRDNRNLHVNPMVSFFRGQGNFEQLEIFKFEDPEHRKKIKEICGYSGKFPHITGDTYAPDLDYSLPRALEETIKQHYIEDFERFYPELL